MDAEWLHRQNRKLKEEITSLKNQIRCLEDDSITKNQILEKIKDGHSKLSIELKQAKFKQQNLKIYYQEREKQFEFVIRKIEEELIQKNQQYQKLEGKIAPLIDADTVRLKVLNQVEYPHRLEIQTKNQQIERLREDLFDSKRKIQQVLTRMQAQNLQHERSVRELKTKHKLQIDNARIDLQSLKCAQAVKGSKQQMQSVLKQDISYYQQSYLRSEQSLNVLRQDMQKMRDHYDQKLRQMIETISSLQRQNSRLKQGSLKF